MRREKTIMVETLEEKEEVEEKNENSEGVGGRTG